MKKRDPRTPELNQFTCTCLALHATRQPAATAVVHLGNPVTYRRLATHVLAVMDELTAAGIERGQILGVQASDRYLHLAILLAAEVLGVTTMSLGEHEIAPPSGLGRLCDRLMVSRPLPVSDPARVFMMTPDWIAGVLASPEDDQPLHRLQRQAEPNATLLLMRTSGTTGVPKVMGMSHGLLQRQIGKLLLHAAPLVTPHPDFLCLYNFSVRGAYTRAMLTLQFGGTIQLTGADVLWDTIVAGIGNYVFFVSGDLERFIRAAPYDRGPFNIHIDVVGGAVSSRLRQETRTKITSHIAITYSSNEAHHVSLVDDDNVGTLFSDARVSIVDDHGRPVPPGQPGLIRVKTDTMIEGYIDAAEPDRTAFVDGWFHTNDFGYQPSGRTLVVLGRADDVLNLGGVKIAPGPIEGQLRAIDGIRDALVTSVDDHLDTSAMLVAIQLEPDGDQARIVPLITPLIRPHVSYFQLMFVSAFPRTETGKIQRQAVKDLFRRQALTL